MNRSKYITFYEWMQTHTPDKIDLARTYVDAWLSTHDNYDLDAKFTEAFGDKWLAYKAYKRITR